MCRVGRQVVDEREDAVQAGEPQYAQGLRTRAHQPQPPSPHGYVIAHAQRVGVRAASVAVAACLVALVGVSRMYLGVHYPTDVLGALLEGLAWIALGLALRRRIAPRIDKARKEA